MEPKSKLESRRMKQPLSSLIQQYAADLRLRNRSPRTIRLNSSILGYVEAYLRRGQPDVGSDLGADIGGRARGYITSMMDRETLYEGHPLRKTREEKLSPYTIHQHVRIIHCFGSWLRKNGYPNRLDEVQYPKLPKRLIDVLSEEEIATLFNLYNPRPSLVHAGRPSLPSFCSRACGSQN